MAMLLIDSFSVEDLQQIANDPTEITIQISWDSNAGEWGILAKGPLGTIDPCPKPCGKVKLQS
jgi:hypothetical protein